MTETQYITLLIGLAITIGANITVVLIGLLMNNGRLTDVKEALRAEIRADIAEVKATETVHHSELLQRFADLDTRLSRIER